MKRYLLLIAALLVISTAILLSAESNQSFNHESELYNITVYEDLPVEDLSYNVSEDAVAFTNKNGDIWIETNRLNRTEFQNYCDEMVFYNIFRETEPLDDEWYDTVAEKQDNEVCTNVTERAVENGLL